MASCAAAAQVQGRRRDRQRQVQGRRRGRQQPRLTVLKKLLDDIVPEHIRHERQAAGHDLGEREGELLGRHGLQLLLDEAAAVLVQAELKDVAKDVLHGVRGRAGGSTGR